MRRNDNSTPEHLKFRHHADLPRLPGMERISLNVTRDNVALALFVASENADSMRARSPGGMFPEPVLADPVAATLVEFTPDYAMATELSDVSVAFPLLGRTGSGTTVIAGARCRYRPGNPDRNGLIYDADGRLVRAILLGDGINDLCCDGQDRIWASYFDEGVYGNFGWNMGGGADNQTIGAHGLVCFRTDGEKEWEFPHHVGTISDCYALNVASDRVFAFYYTDFDVCEIGLDLTTRVRATDVAGCSAFATHSGTYLFSAQYGEDWTTGHLATPGSDNALISRRVTFDLPGWELPEHPQLITGRGSTLNIFTGTDWFQHDLAHHRY